MIERDNNTIRSIAWSEVFPWLSILRVFRIAVAARVLVLAALAIRHYGDWLVGTGIDLWHRFASHELVDSAFRLVLGKQLPITLYPISLCTQLLSIR